MSESQHPVERTVSVIPLFRETHPGHVSNPSHRFQMLLTRRSVYYYLLWTMVLLFCCSTVLLRFGSGRGDWGFPGICSGVCLGGSYAGEDAAELAVGGVRPGARRGGRVRSLLAGACVALQLDSFLSACALWRQAWCRAARAFDTTRRV